MRRLLHLVLLAVLGLPFLTPYLALGQRQDASLPICCRRAGEHHCALAAGDPTAIPTMHAPWLRCGRFPQNVAPAQSNPLSTPPARAILASAPKDLACVLADTDSKRRIARDRSRQKRGPPSPTHS